MKSKLKNIIARIMGEKLAYRMILIYLIGGVLPLGVIDAYLIHGTNKILVEQAENTELTELEMIVSQVEDLQKNMSMVTQYFYFDPLLEKIAQTEYTDYQEMIDDYRGYTQFVDYRKYYNIYIARASIYFENQTLRQNMSFVVVDDNIRSQEWYQKVSQPRSGIVWTYLPSGTMNYRNEKLLTLTRMIKTEGGEDVGVVAIYLRPERFNEMITGRNGGTALLLNGTLTFAESGEKISDTILNECVAKQDADEWQQRIELEDGEYIVTSKIAILDDSKDFIQVISVQAVDDILADANEQSIHSIWLVATCILLAFLLIFAFSWNFGRRVEHFREQMQKAAAGEFQLEERLGGNDEISELYDYLGTMIWKIQKLLAEVYREKIHAEQLKTKQKDAEFQMLTSQINPHFLYNTLETIRMKARVNKQYEIEDLVKMLGKILRSSIQSGEKDVSVSVEVELVECYLKIQQYRFGDRIDYEIEVEEDIKEYKILPLILQPVVENCMIHGLENKEDMGHINILVAREENYVMITVSDDGCGMEEDKLQEIKNRLKSDKRREEHIGICNVHQRLRLKYGEEYGVTITSQVGQGTTVKMNLPWIEA